MPTYDYVCDACGHEFEQFQSITAATLKKCPACGKAKLRRLIGIGAGILFKGSGFYETDYRSDSYKQGAKADKESATPKTDKDTATSKADATAKGASSAKSEAAKSAAPAKKAEAKPAPAAK